ncbi:MAG TPA: phosphodiester glycosidase family protein, partial [Ktedonobacteraceae bacterium]
MPLVRQAVVHIEAPQELTQQQFHAQQQFALPVVQGAAQPVPAQQPHMTVFPRAVVSQPLRSKPLARFKQQKKPKGKMTRGKLLRRALVVCSILTIIAVVFMSQANGASGAGVADLLRSVFGPTITAQVESWYLGLSDTTHQVQYNLGGQQVEAPWTVGTVAPLPMPAIPPKAAPLIPMPLGRITPMITPALNGECIWATQSIAPSPYGYLPLDAKAFIRPDPTHPYAIVTLLQFDTRFFKLHMVAGTIEPGGPRGFYGSGVIPAADQKGNALLAAFNGGFKYADGQYGLKTNGIVYVPPQPHAATIAVTKSGQIILGAWGADSRLNSGNSDLVAWRQNASLLIDNGKINPLTQDGAAWGGTILNAAYTWRSGVGITAHGTLIYGAGSYLTALTLGEALKAAGAVMAMQTDINPFWVRAFLYSRNTHGAWNIVKLNPAMYGTGTEYLSATQRDFFYLTRFSPSLPPPRQR